MLTGKAEFFRRTGSGELQEGGDDVRYSWPLWAGLHMCYNGDYKELRHGDMKLISKSYLSSDWSLQFGTMKLESLVIVDQHATVNTFSGLVHTARRAMEVGLTGSR